MQLFSHDQTNIANAEYGEDIILLFEPNSKFSYPL